MRLFPKRSIKSIIFRRLLEETFFRSEVFMYPAKSGRKQHRIGITSRELGQLFFFLVAGSWLRSRELRGSYRSRRCAAARLSPAAEPRGLTAACDLRPPFSPLPSPGTGSWATCGAPVLGAPLFESCSGMSTEYTTTYVLTNSPSLKDLVSDLWRRNLFTRTYCGDIEQRSPGASCKAIIDSITIPFSRAAW